MTTPKTLSEQARECANSFDGRGSRKLLLALADENDRLRFSNIRVVRCAYCWEGTTMVRDGEDGRGHYGHDGAFHGRCDAEEIERLQRWKCDNGGCDCSEVGPNTIECEPSGWYVVGPSGEEIAGPFSSRHEAISRMKEEAGE